MRLNVNGQRLPIRVKSEPEAVHVHAHGLTLFYFAALELISKEHMPRHASHGITNSCPGLSGFFDPNLLAFRNFSAVVP